MSAMRNQHDSSGETRAVEDEHICCVHTSFEPCCLPGHAAWLMKEGVR